MVLSRFFQRSPFRAVCFIFWTFGALLPGWALGGATGTLQGYLRDPDGNPAANVEIAIRGAALDGRDVCLDCTDFFEAAGPVVATARRVKTDARGYYRFDRLPPGTGYILRFMPDAHMWVEHILVSELHADQTLRLPDIRLKVGDITECFSNRYVEPILDQSSSGPTFIMTGADLQRLPLP